MNLPAADDCRRNNSANTAENIDVSWRILLYLIRYRIIIKMGQTFPAPLQTEEVSTMTKTNPLTIARLLLADTVAKSERRPPWPLNISPWIAMSLLQKAIRRGNEDLALHAATTLLENSPERLWRRCGGIAFEDVGLADIETLSLVAAALAGKRPRAQLGGEWTVASCIVSRMARAAKCRAADDLLMSAQLHPAYQRVRDQLASARTQDLLEMVIGPSALWERAIALWYAIGTDRRPSRHLRPR